MGGFFLCFVSRSFLRGLFQKVRAHIVKHEIEQLYELCQFLVGFAATQHFRSYRGKGVQPLRRSVHIYIYYPREIVDNLPKTVDKIPVRQYNNDTVRPWRNWQTRTFEGRMGDRPSSSLGGRTKMTPFRCHFFMLFGRRSPAAMVRTHHRRERIGNVLSSPGGGVEILVLLTMQNPEKKKRPERAPLLQFYGAKNQSSMSLRLRSLMTLRPSFMLFSALSRMLKASERAS